MNSLQDTKGLSEKAKTSLQTVIDRLSTGDISPLVSVIQDKIRLPDNAPARKWTFSNQVLAYCQTGTLDCRGYNQWQEAGRQVRKGTHGAFILAPRIVKTKNKDGDDEPRLVGFLGVSVHPYGNTDGDNDDAFTYAPVDLPPLTEVADRMGVSYSWEPVPDDRYGDYSPDKDRIHVGTKDAKTWFHELAHAAHARVESLQSQDLEKKEAVAELTATVLMDLYDLGDRTGNCWDYIQMFSTNPLQAIQRSLGAVEKILDILFDSEAK